MTHIHKTIEFEAKISKTFDILTSRLASKIYTKLLASLGGHITLRLRLLHKYETGYTDNTKGKHFIKKKEHLISKYNRGEGGACGTSNYRNPVCKFAKFPFIKPIK